MTENAALDQRIQHGDHTDDDLQETHESTPASRLFRRLPQRRVVATPFNSCLTQNKSKSDYICCLWKVWRVLLH